MTNVPRVHVHNNELATQPLLKPDRGKPKPPLTGPEIDDLDDELENPPDTGPYPGIDEGLLEPDGHKLPDGHPLDGVDRIESGFGDDRPISPFPGVPPNMNTYQQKKNLAQGMMDLALLSANANQLHYVLEFSSSHPYFYPSVIFISLSIVLQIGVGVGLIMNSRYNVNKKEEVCKADKINNMTLVGVFLVIIVNVFITSFSVASSMASI